MNLTYEYTFLMNTERLKKSSRKERQVLVRSYICWRLMIWDDRINDQSMRSEFTGHVLYFRCYENTVVTISQLRCIAAIRTFETYIRCPSLSSVGAADSSDELSERLAMVIRNGGEQSISFTRWGALESCASLASSGQLTGHTGSRQKQRPVRQSIPN